MDNKKVESVLRKTIGRLEGMAALTESESLSDSLMCWAEELAVCLGEGVMSRRELQESDRNEYQG